jgi:hypothetical protein
MAGAGEHDIATVNPTETGAITWVSARRHPHEGALEVEENAPATVLPYAPGRVAQRRSGNFGPITKEGRP